MVLFIINCYLENISGQERILWALENFPGLFVLSSSFGIHAAVCIHIIKWIKPYITVILTDTGYLFPETYQWIKKIKKNIDRNVRVFRTNYSKSWQESCYGKLWEQGMEGIEQYNHFNKVEPMNKEMKNYEVKIWFSGLRRPQSSSRAYLNVLAIQCGLFKILPIIDWDNYNIDQYLYKKYFHSHPLWKKGYLSVGDINTTKKCKEGRNEEKTRFFGLKRECGLHKNSSFYY